MRLYDHRQWITNLKDLSKSLNKQLDQLEELMQYAPPSVKDKLTKQFYPTLKETTAQFVELSKRRRKKDMDKMQNLLEQSQKLRNIANLAKDIINSLKENKTKISQEKKLLNCMRRIDNTIFKLGFVLIGNLGLLYVEAERQKELNSSESKDKKRNK